MNWMCARCCRPSREDKRKSYCPVRARTIGNSAPDGCRFFTETPEKPDRKPKRRRKAERNVR